MCKNHLPLSLPPHSLFSLHSAPSTVVIKEKLHPFVRLSPRIMDAAPPSGVGGKKIGQGMGKISPPSPPPPPPHRRTQLPSSNCEGVQVAAPPSATWNNCFSNYCCCHGGAAEEENCVGGVFHLLSRSRLGREPICPLLLLFGYIFGGFSTVVLPGGGRKAR